MADTDTRERPDLASWLDDEPAGPRRRVRLGVVLVVAAIPWLVVAAAVLGPGGRRDLPITAPVSSTTPVVPPSGSADQPATGSVTRSPAGEPASVVSSSARTTATLAEAAAIGLVVGRAFATGHGAPLDVDGAGRSALDGYVEHLVVEAVDHPGPDAAVVTLLAVVLHAQDGRYATAEVRRLAVPVHVDGGGARPAGTPWWLPPPDLTAREVALTDVADEDLLVAAAEAIAAAGYVDVATLTLSTTAAWPLVADLTATAPGDTAPTSHRLWLRRHLDGLVVAGHRDPASASVPPASDAPSAPALPATSPPPTGEAVP